MWYGVIETYWFVAGCFMPQFSPFCSESHSTVHWLASILTSISTAKDTDSCVKPFNVFKRTAFTSPTGQSRRSSNLGRVGRWTSTRLSEVLRDVSNPGLLELATFYISFSTPAKVPLRTAGVTPFLASSISVLLAKGRSQCVMSMMWRDEWDQHFSFVLWWAGKDQYYSILQKIYTAIL